MSESGIPPEPATAPADPLAGGFVLPPSPPVEAMGLTGYAAPSAGSPEGALRPFSALGCLGSLALVVLVGIGAALGGQFLNYLGGALEVVPFGVIAILAFVGRRHVFAMVVAHLLNVGLVLLTVLVLAAVLFAALQAGGGPPRAPVWQPWVVFLAWALAGVLAAVLMPIPAISRSVARLLPIRAGDSVHTVALGLVISFTLLAFGQLIATGGRPPILTLLNGSPAFGQMEPSEVVGGVVFGFLWIIPGTAVAVGWPTARSFREALGRLGIVPPTRRQVGGALLVAVAMVVVFQGLDFALGAVWNWTHWPKTDTQAFERLMAPLITPTGAVLIGVTAGVGEELAIRGALQPRLGIWLPNLFFTSLHAFQYGFDGLISVFLAGTVLGLVRARTNTSTSAIVHGTYDFILVMASVVMK